MSAPPKVTVFIPVYNRAAYVGGAIESVLAQSFADFELLLIDDGSADESVAVIRRYADPRIRLVRNERNEGIPRTRSKGVELARGEYFAVLDSDDQAPPRRLERQVAFLDRRRDIAVVGGWATEMDAAGRPLRRLKPLPLAPDELRARLLFRSCHHHSSVMGRAALFKEYRYRERFPVSSDYDLFVRLSERHRLANLPRVFLRRRVHGGRVTRERAELVKAMNLEIVSGQLAALGVAYDAADLDRHFLLMRLGRLGVAPDRAFLDWAAAWLEGLQAANCSARLYPERGLAGVLGQVWLLACRHAAPALGRAAWTRFLDSPLRAGVAASLRMNLAFAATGR